MNETSTQQHKKYKILLLGDSCIDRYIIGDVERISPEAPVPVLSNTKSTDKWGMAANVKENLVALGCQVWSYTNCPESIVKTRYIDRKTNTHLLRVDKEDTVKPLNVLHKVDVTEFDAVVISDYNKGSVTYNLIKDVLKLYQGPVFIDTKKIDLAEFASAYVKINDKERGLIVSQCENLIVTLGKQGATYKDKIYPVPSVEVADVCGAGDTFLAALAYKFVDTQDIDQAIEFANLASSITVQHLGVYAPRLEEIE